MRIAVWLLMLATLLAGCTNARDRLDQSTAPVLVPEDERFLVQWGFTLDEAPDNYTARAHWDPSFNPDIDPDLVVESYQINDRTAWTGTVPAEDDATRDALISVFTDSAASAPPCESLADATAVVMLCRYDVGQSEVLPVLVRRIDNTVMLVLGESPAQRDYITGSFRAVAPADAEEWFTG